MTSTRAAEPRAGRLPAFWLVGGKGGVGKTTCAAALALAAARNGRRTLVITTDPAPSLADAFRSPPAPRPCRVAAAPGTLHIHELDARRAFERWLAGRRATLERIVTAGTWLDADDAAALLRLSLPGIDEIAALVEILSLGRAGRHDLVIVDTAPTGHTLRLLALPDVLGRAAAMFDLLQDRRRAVVAALRGRWAPEAADTLIAELSGAAADVGRLLRDTARTRLHWVTLPEPVALAETLSALDALSGLGVPVASIVVNRVTPAPPSPCPHCAARHAYEGRILREARSRVPDLPLQAVEAQAREPRGSTALRRIARDLAADYAPGPAARAVAWRAWAHGRGRPHLDGVFPDALRLLLVGGKGGVGKSTCASAVALHLAAVRPDRQVLLASADPAHSIGDVLRAALDDRARRAPGAPPNLRVREIDAEARMAIVRSDLTRAVGTLMAGRPGHGLEADRGGRTLSSLLELAPPGLDELIAVAELADMFGESGGFDLVILDLPPTGHALRLLEAPGLVQEWVRSLMRMLLKYQAVTRIENMGSQLLGLSKRIGSLQKMLRDPLRCGFLPVARAAALPRAETGRLIAHLRRLGIRPRALLVNATGHGSCIRCHAASRGEARELGELARLAEASGIPLLVTPAQIPPPAGVRGLRQWGAAWRVHAPHPSGPANGPRR